MHHRFPVSDKEHNRPSSSSSQQSQAAMCPTVVDVVLTRTVLWSKVKTSIRVSQSANLVGLKYFKGVSLPVLKFRVVT
jgi:hypothetical protein